jgi:hypothetical protein
MPNATVRANARTMPEATNRRAVLGAILTAGAAVGLPAALASAAAPAPTLSPLDKRVEDLWLRRRRLKAIADQLNERWDAAADSLPAWAKPGPNIVSIDGTPRGKVFSDWPQVADLSRRPSPFPKGDVYARPDVKDILAEWSDNGRAKNANLARALIEWGERVLEQESEMERAGLDEYSERLDHAHSLIRDVEDTFRERMGESAFALAAVLVAEIELKEPEDVPGLAAASLAAIRPQISGPIAEDADRVLAERDDDGADGPSAPETKGRAA